MFDIYRNREDIWLSHQMWKEVDEKYKELIQDSLWKTYFCQSF